MGREGGRKGRKEVGAVLHTKNVARGRQTESFQNVGGAKVYTMY